ncbi:MAG: hypothetical protein KJN60_11125 [Boseongicola sp.]|nr:hypothetical protein [Boseongicola sp.]
MILGLLVLFRKYLAVRGPWLGRLEGNIYGVYLIHLFVVIAVQMVLLDIGLPALAKFAVVVIGTLVISFPAIALLRRLPGMRAIL